MSYRELFLQLISLLLGGKISREDVAARMAREVPIDKNYEEDQDLQELLDNCEWALRHVNEPDYYTSTGELKYYLRCLKGEEVFRVEERDRHVAEKPGQI